MTGAIEAPPPLAEMNDYFRVCTAVRLLRGAQSLTRDEISDCMRIVRDDFAFTATCSDEELEPSVRYAVAIAQKIRTNGCVAISLIDVDSMKKLLGLPLAFIFNLVDILCEVCTIPENDITGSVTQLMGLALTGQMPAYAEFYVFFENSLLMGRA